MKNNVLQKCTILRLSRLRCNNSQAWGVARALNLTKIKSVQEYYKIITLWLNHTVARSLLAGVHTPSCLQHKSQSSASAVQEHDSMSYF